MFKALNAIIENKISESNLDFYTVIIGTKPSQGARSPKLWNRVYDYEQKRIQMVPLDVKSDKLEMVFNYLKEDKLCLGGAVAVPYKEKIIKFTNNRDEIIAGPQAVNCLVREDGKLYGYNTDGIATYKVLNDNVSLNTIEQIILLGTGGMAKAVSSEIQKNLSDINLLIFDRNNNCFTFQKGKLNKNKQEIDKKLNTVLINCSSAGYYNEINKRKINSEVFNIHTFLSRNSISKNLVESISTLKSFKNLVFILDVIYQPDKTLLLSIADYLGIPNQNGLEINLLQAAISFAKVHPDKNLNKIFKIMSS